MQEDKIQEEKEAVTLNGALNAMTAIDGAKQMKNSYDATENKYDNLMGTTVSKGGVMGSGNKSIARRTASENIEYLCKEAGFKQKASKVFKGVATKLDNIDKKNVENISLGVKNLKNGNIKDGLKHSAKALAVTAPALGAAGLAGVGTAKGLNKIDDKFSSKRDNRDENKLQRRFENNALGVAMTTALVGNAVAGKGMGRTLKKVTESVSDGAKKYPSKIIKKNVPGSKVFFDAIQKAKSQFGNRDKIIAGHAKKLFNDYEKQGANKDLAKLKSSYIDNLKKDFTKIQASKSMSDAEIDTLWNKTLTENESTIDEAIERLHNRNKKASDQIDYLFEKVAGAKSNYAKKVFKENFCKRD